jgi:hypothetical protein
MMDSGPNDPHDTTVEHDAFPCPVPNKLIIDGRNFVKYCSRLPNLFRSRCFRQSDNETLSSYRVLHNFPRVLSHSVISSSTVK